VPVLANVSPYHAGGPKAINSPSTAASVVASVGSPAFTRNRAGSAGVPKPRRRTLKPPEGGTPNAIPPAGIAGTVMHPDGCRDLKADGRGGRMMVWIVRGPMRLGAAVIGLLVQNIGL
jgi:hypothetical protein